MDDKIKKSIGITLRNIRKSKLLKVPEVSNDTGISIDTIYRYEQGRGNDIDTLGKLIEYYELDFVIFFKKSYDNSHNQK